MSGSIRKHLQALDHYWRGEPEIRLVHKLCDPTRTAIDIGANIGTYTYFMRKYAAAVWAYEPNPILAKRLARLYPDVQVRAVAVSDSIGLKTLRIPGRLHELGSVATDATGDPIEVPSIRLDDERQTDVGFIKIDVERHELSVLRGAMETIALSRPVIMVEVTPLLYKSPLPETFRFLTDLGYIGSFRFKDGYLPFSEFCTTKHAAPDAFGTPDFMGNNVIFRPIKNSASRSGHSRSRN